MNINRNNYEAYFLDYREKNLSPEQVAELVIFLEQNPDLKTFFDAYEEIELKANNSIKFTSKKNLKKTEVVATVNISQENYEEIMIDKYEGELSHEEDEKLKAFLAANPKLKLELNLLKSTFLKPDDSIIFSDKESLKKRGVLLLYGTQFMYSLAVAATIIILLGVYFGFLNQNQSNTFEDTFVLNKIEMVQPKLVGEFVEIPEIELRSSVYPVKSALQENDVVVKVEERDKDLVVTVLNSVPTGEIDISSDPTNQSYKITSRNNELLATTDFIFPKDDKKDKSFFGKFVSGLAGKLINTENVPKKSFVEYTVDGFNFLTDQDVFVDKKVDENGKVVAYNINGNNINLSRTNKEKSSE